MDVELASPEPPPPPVAVGPQALPDLLAGAVVFLASGAVLVLEVVGLRLLGPYLGVTLETSSSVIGIALAAIAYGAWTGGWLADRVDPRRLLGPALVLAAAATAVTLPLVRWAGEYLRGSSDAGVLLLTALAVFTPSALLAGITPLVVKLQLGDVRHTGRIVGKLSSIGTLGGITATLGTGFILVAALPTSAILIGLALVLALAGFGLFAYLWRLDRSSVRLSSARPGAVIAVLVVVGAALTTLAPNPCDVETAYHCARIETDPARPTGRLLVLNSAHHSYVDLADPRHLEFAYTQWMGAVADVSSPAGRPVRALHVGGGGFTMPRYLQATRPGSFNRVLELDGELVALDKAKLGVVPGPDLDIIVGDARLSLARQSDADFDLVIGDAFGHLAVPWHLTTTEFVREIRRVLTPGGVYVLNVIDTPPLKLIRAEIATVLNVFPQVAVIAPPSALSGRNGSNFVIVASAKPLALGELRTWAAGLTEVVTVLSGPELAAFVADATPLTDDFAPVDQLLTR